MRKIIWLMHVSLDGFISRPDGSLNWVKMDDELWDYVTTVTDSSDTALFGEVTYHMMEEYWPTAAEQPNASKHDIEHAKWANTVEKIVFSKTLQETHWAGVRIVRDNIAEEMQKLKEQPGKNLLMLGSPSLAQSFIKLGLIDEFCLNINPVVLGTGKPLFREAPEFSLKLISEHTLASGVVALRYEKINS